MLHHYSKIEQDVTENNDDKSDTDDEIEQDTSYQDDESDPSQSIIYYKHPVETLDYLS